MENILIKQKTKTIHFERAIFTSWYCNLGDCAYCYMSTQKSKISEPEKARRSIASILAEAYLCKKLGWKIGFLSAGYGSYTAESILELCKNVYEIYGEKFWLNIGVLNEKTIEKVSPYLKGVCGAVETVNDDVRKKVIPNKHLASIEEMYRICEKFNLKKSMTFIVGLGEQIDDFPLLKDFIIRNNIKKIIFYALNPIEGTIFENSKGPEINYFIEWIRKTRENFPNIDIVVGHWVNRVNYIHLMIDAGANAITKFPAIKLFNSMHAKNIEKEIKTAGFELQGTFTKIPDIDYDEIKHIKNRNFDDKLKNDIIKKVKQYIRTMNR
ncbi:MAG: radical SAM protein [Candidatus Woesearchaeota archaeon]|nr:radical SAM protein [Candidatus Woesearchaeota archaeon]